MPLHAIVEEGRYEQRAHNMLAREVAKWSNAVRKAEKIKRAHLGQTLDIIQSDFHRDPMAVIENIYRFIGAELTDDVRTAMQQRIADDPERQHGAHRYNVADFGMSEEEIRECFGDYIARFDLAPKKPLGEKI
jgi:hypothetical protein